MTRRARGRLALVGLVIVVTSFGIAFGTSRPARVRYWTWRIHSSDLAVRQRARVKLMDIGHPEIDGVFAEVVAGEAFDRVTMEFATRVSMGRGDLTAKGELHALLAPVPDPGPDAAKLETMEDTPEPSCFLGPQTPERQQLVVAFDRVLRLGPHRRGIMREVLLVVALPDDAGLSDSVLNATRARLQTPH